MNRRSFVRGVVALAAGAAGAGCANNREFPATAPEVPVTGTERENPIDGGGDGDTGPVDGVDDLTITTGPGDRTDRPTERPTATPVPFANQGFDWVEGDDGDLVIPISIANESGTAGTATVRATVTVDGEEYRDGAAVDVPAGETERVRLAFPVDFEAFERSLNVDFDIESGAPETPFPTDASPASDAETGTGTATNG